MHVYHVYSQRNYCTIFPRTFQHIIVCMNKYTEFCRGVNAYIAMHKANFRNICHKTLVGLTYIND